MPRRLRPAYTVIDNKGNKTFYKTKKEICERYGMKIGWVNKAIICYPLKVTESPVRIRFYTCKDDCHSYMIKDCTCPWYKNQVKALRRKKNESTNN